MDKGKSRTDLLTAGRKKLQQFRKKKDNKGGSSNAKASGKASKPEKDGDPDAHPVSDADTTNVDGRPVDFLVAPSSGEPEEVHTISLVDQEVNHLGSEQCNGESFVGGANVALGSEGPMEDVDSVPSYGNEMVREVDESSITSHEQLGDCPVSSYADNGTDGSQIPIEECGMDIETSALAQETNHSTVAPDELDGAGGGSTHAEENMEMPSSSQNYSSNEGTYAGAMVEELPEAGPDFSGNLTENTSLGESSSMPHDIPAAEGAECFFAADGEDEHRDDEKGMHSQGNPEANRAPVPGTLQQDMEHLSIKTEESTFLEDTPGIILSMSQDTPASEGRDGSFIAIENGGREKNEEGLHQYGETHVTNRSSICGEALQEANTIFFDKPEVTTYNEENLETLARPSEDIPENKEVCGVRVDLEEVRRANDGGLLLSSLGDDVTVDSEYMEEIQKKWPIIIGEKDDEIHKMDRQVGNSGYDVEGVKELLYKTMVEKDIFQFQLAEQIKFSTEYQQHSTDEMSKLWDMMKETQTSKTLVDEELEQNRSRLQAMSTAKEELEALCLSAKGEIQELHSGASELQSKLEQSQEELSRVLIELADCRVSLEAIQKEKLDLGATLNSETDMRKKIMEENERSQEELSRVLIELADCRGSLEAIQKEKLDLEANLNFETNARKKLVEENEFYFCENKKLAGEMLEQKERLVIALDEQAQLQSVLRDTVPPFEQLAEENMYLSSSLDIHKAKIKELEGRQMESLSQANKAGKEDMSLIKKDVVEDSSNSFELGVLKQCLDHANNIMQDLENSVEGMHSLSMSLRSGGRAAGPGISKIIQAFESKAQQVESVADEIPSIEGGDSEDSYTFIKEHTSNLKHLLKKMEVDVGMAETHCMQIQNRRNLPEQVVKSNTQSEENSILQERISKLVEKMSDYESRISDLQNYIDEIQLSAKDEAVRLSSQVEILQTEVNERVSILQQEEDSIRGILVEAIEKLDTSTGLQVNDDSDVGSHVIASVDAAVLEIMSLHEKLEASHLNYNILQISHEELNKLSMDMQGKIEIATAQLSKIYNSIREFVNDSYQDAGEALVDVNANEALGVVPGNCHFLIERLKVLLDERLHVLSTNAELEAGLSNRNLEIEELSMRYSSLVKKLEDECHSKESLESNLMDRNKIIEELNNMVFTLVKKLEDHGLGKDLDAKSGFAEFDNTENEFDRSLLLRLEALIASHLKRYEEAVEQINLSKSYLQEVNISTEMTVDNWSLPMSTLIKQEFVPKVSELQESLQLLSDSNLQHETKIQTLKENLSKLEATLEESRSELNLKISEFEQSEQRLSSVREKLSIAVAKGKGLIVQRDNLKQSLNEKSNELEKCMQELQSKEALLQEVEAKLKSCSEVDRVEALESELSYIRDSATALRDSFLLKDSVLQRIEEVLEDLDLPEHFHSKDIVEKIELLSRVVVGHPSLTDWDQKNLEGHSHSDAGFGIDAWKDDIPSPSHEFDEFKRKYEELERKFYALAEHNDMLEQSLTERNRLVQKWEEMMDDIDIPPHLRTLEPEDRIKCLGRALFEIQQERDALQVRIENLEVSSDMLVVDVEESHKKISELSAELVAVKSEKEFYSGSLDKLRQEYLALSEKAVHEEFDRENLQKEVAELQEKLAENRDRHDIETDVQQLLDLVTSALPDSDKVEVVFSGGTGVESLEKLLRKLIDNYTTMSMDRSMHKVVDKEVLLEENNLALDEKTSGDVMDDKDQELVALRSGLEETSHSLSLVKQERDAAMAKCNTLLLEIEEMTSQMNIWQDQRISDTQKYQALVLELEATGKQRDALQDQLNQEEQKSAVAREKLNVAVRKGKGLVQQRDALKQTIEEMNHVVEHSKIEHNQQLEALKSEKTLLLNRLTETEQKFQESSQNLSRLLTVLNAIYVSSEVNIVNPVQKLEEIGKLNNDLQSALVSSEHDAKKSKRTAELLLAELNEVQERADILHEELEKAEAALMECSKQKDVAEVTKADAVSRLEQIMQFHSDERKKQISNMVELKSGFDQLKKCCLGFSSLLSSALRKDVALFSYVEFFLKDINGEHVPDLQFPGSSNLLFSNPTSEDCSHALDGIWDSEMHSLSNDSSITEQLVHACSTLHECLRQYDHLKECIEKHSFSIDQQSKGVFETLQTVKGTVHSQKEISESLRRDVSSLELMAKEKETESSSMRRNISVLYEACNKCIVEVENRNGQMVVNNVSLEGHVSGKSNMSMTLPSEAVGKESADGHNFPYTDDSIRLMADSLLSTVKGSRNIDEIAERNQRESRETILKLQSELQEKNREINKICEELVSQIREAETRAKRSESELDSSRTQVISLEKEVAAMVNDKKVLESRVNELKNCEASLKDLQDRFKVLTDTLEAKDQEIEALMQALDEEESQMEALENRNMELVNVVQGKMVELENLEASRANTLAKLSTTVSKFDELHNLSESLLAEIESLQSQLQERDSEVSFLRQEVTRCTNDVLASQETSKNYSSEIHELLSLMEKMATRFGGSNMQTSDQNQSSVRSYIDIIDKKLVDAIDELEDLRVTVQRKDSLLQVEKGKVEELLSKMEELETLSGKGNQRERFQGERDPGPSSSMNSPRTLETEQMVQRNKVSSGPIVAHIRSGRKVNNDQIAIAIDAEKDDNTIDDEDDDKAHGFKSLTMSRLIPRATRPISDRIDGIWVSAERLLMRQPSLRLGVIVYWVVLHALLASFI